MIEAATQLHSQFQPIIRSYSTTTQQGFSRLTTRFTREIGDYGVTRPTLFNRQIRKGLTHIKYSPWELKMADKNLGLVLLDKNKYKSMVLDQLQQGGFLPEQIFPHNRICAKVRRLMKSSPFSTTTNQFFIQEAENHPTPCHFYILPKIHKATLGARPITAQHSYALSALSRRLSKELNGFVKQHRGITPHSKRVVQEIEQLVISGPCYFLTYDVESLYPSIDIQDALEVLTTHLPQFFNRHRRFWIRLLEVIMTENHVEFNGKTYWQSHGTATGTAAAPPFANLYLLFKFDMVFRRFNHTIIYNRRYIDDGLLLINDDKQIPLLQTALNECSNLNLTWQTSTTMASTWIWRYTKAFDFMREVS